MRLMERKLCLDFFGLSFGEFITIITVTYRRQQASTIYLIYCLLTQHAR